MNYTDSWISEQAALSRQTCPSCGALNCTGVCVLGDLLADLERYEPMLEEMNAFIWNMGMSHNEAFQAVWKGENPCWFEYESFSSCVQELRDSVSKIRAAEEAKKR